MLECIFQEHLDRAGYHKHVLILFRHIHLQFEARLEPHFHKVGVHSDKGQLLPQAYGHKILILKHIPVHPCQFQNECMGLVILPVKDEAVQGVERVEQEMRVNLLLELEIFELGLVSLVRLCVQGLS